LSQQLALSGFARSGRLSLLVSIENGVTKAITRRAHCLPDSHGGSRPGAFAGGEAHHRRCCQGGHVVETEGLQASGIADSFRPQVEAETPLGRIGQPHDIAMTAVFLASSDSAWITGENFVVAGGYR
jgi:Enoyl-(Acyl carrier protein) reductase